MRAPSWWEHSGLLSTLLKPLSCLYSGAGMLRAKIVTPQKMSVPVLCVGNFTAGGAGKTPTVMALAYKLTAMGERPHVISRGYGGSITESTMVDVTAHKAFDVGDEPLLISKAAPCWVGSRRVDSARSAIARGATVLLMDDGFQNPELVKDVNLVVVDGGYGIGNGAVIPAGPLREPLEEALSRADYVLIIGDDVHKVADRVGSVPVLQATIEANDTLEDKKYIAFAGIGRPEKFVETLKDMGIEPLNFHAFPDHYEYNTGEIEALLAEAKEKNTTLITTTKDAVKIDEKYMASIAVLPVALSFDADNDKVDDLLNNLMEDGGV